MPTVESGIKRKEVSGACTFVSYCPGNGTKYDLMFTELTSFSDGAKDLMGVSEKCWLVTSLNQEPRPSALITNNGQLLHWAYVGEKLGLRTPDAVVVAELIGHITGRPYITGEEVMSDLAEELVSSEQLPKPNEDGEETEAAT